MNPQLKDPVYTLGDPMYGLYSSASMYRPRVVSKVDSFMYYTSTTIQYKGKNYNTQELGQGSVNGGAFYYRKTGQLGLTKEGVIKPFATALEKDVLSEANRLKSSEPNPLLTGALKVKMKLESGVHLQQTAAWLQHISRGTKDNCNAWILLVRAQVRTEHARWFNRGFLQLDNNIGNYLWRDVSVPTATDPGIRPNMVDFGGGRRPTVSLNQESFEIL
jgi:hypothetical protein